MYISPLFSFPISTNNKYPNLRIFIHFSPCDQGIILIDVEQFNLQGESVGSRHLKLLPEGTENQIYFGKDRQIEAIPSGPIKFLEVTTGSDGKHLSLEIHIEYKDGSEHNLTWLTD